MVVSFVQIGLNWLESWSLCADCILLTRTYLLVLSLDSYLQDSLPFCSGLRINVLTSCFNYGGGGDPFDLKIISRI